MSMMFLWTSLFGLKRFYQSRISVYLILYFSEWKSNDFQIFNTRTIVVQNFREDITLRKNPAYSFRDPCGLVNIIRWNLWKQTVIHRYILIWLRVLYFVPKNRYRTFNLFDSAFHQFLTESILAWTQHWFPHVVASSEGRLSVVCGIVWTQHWENRKLAQSARCFPLSVPL